MTARMGIITGVGLVALGAGGAVLGQRMREPRMLPPQPIAFNHRLHLERVQGIACQDCHQFVGTQTYAGLPSKQICFGCHDPTGDRNDPGADVNKQAFSALMGFASTGGDIPWQRITATREHVFFSHRRHVTVAKLDCRECHAYMPTATRPPARGPIMMSMDTCIACHEKSAANTDCVSCHW